MMDKEPSRTQGMIAVAVTGLALVWVTMARMGEALFSSHSSACGWEFFLEERHSDIFYTIKDIQKTLRIIDSKRLTM